MELSHLQARSIVESAWKKVHGRAPSARETLFVLAVASLETGYGRAGQFQKLAQQGLFNWGAEQSRPDDSGVCPVGTAPGGDTYEGQPVSVCFYVSRSDEEAAARIIRTLTVSFPARAQAILAAMRAGQAADVARAMKTAPAYYTAPLETYARGLASKVDVVARGTGLTLAKVGFAWLGSVVLGLGLAGGAWWWFFGRRGTR